MSRAQIEAKLNQMDEKLDETVDGVDRGPVKDALRVVVPMMKDQVAALRLLLDEITH